MSKYDYDRRTAGSLIKGVLPFSLIITKNLSTKGVGGISYTDIEGELGMGGKIKPFKAILRQDANGKVLDINRGLDHTVDRVLRTDAVQKHLKMLHQKRLATSDKDPV
jgi:hypothetical protein